LLQEEIGKRIQRAREEAGISQDELAARVGLTQAALSNYELGKRQPGLNKLERISSALKKPLGYFLEDSGKKKLSTESQKIDAGIREMIELWGDMPEDERQYLLDFIRWRREQSKDNRKE
jgi:transcriptional regulator with XRE-family HTH domain